MISISAIVYMTLTLLVGIILPAAVLIILCARKKLEFRAAAMGMLAVLLSRVVLESGAMNVIYNFASLAFDPENLISSAIVGAIAVALVSEAARLLFAKTSLQNRKEPSFISALSFGVGYGVFGNIVAMGATSIGNITLALSINSGTGVIADYAEQVGQETALQVVQSLAAIPPMEFFAGMVQCLLMLAIEILFSVMMIYFIRNRKNIFIAAIFAAHWALNFGIALMSPHGVWAGEIYIALFAIMLAAAGYEIIRKYRGMDKAQEPELPEQMEFEL